MLWIQKAWKVGRVAWIHGVKSGIEERSDTGRWEIWELGYRKAEKSGKRWVSGAGKPLVLGSGLHVRNTDDFFDDFVI